MKKGFLYLGFFVLVASCAPGPIGAWNYSVTGTPQGDYAGVMTISKKDKGYSAKLMSAGNETTFNKFSYIKATKKTEGDFDFSGTQILFSAQLNKDQLKGTMSTSGLEFPFTATRKK